MPKYVPGEVLIDETADAGVNNVLELKEVPFPISVDIHASAYCRGDNGSGKLYLAVDAIQQLGDHGLGMTPDGDNVLRASAQLLNVLLPAGTHRITTYAPNVNANAGNCCLRVVVVG